MKVEKNTVSREVFTRSTVEDEVFTFELTREQACALHAVLGTIHGHVDTNNVRDVVTSPLWKALEAAGIHWTASEVTKYSRNIRKSMTVGE